MTNQTNQTATAPTTAANTKSSNYVSRLTTKADVNAMMDALRDSLDFTVITDSETAIVTHTASGKEVFRGIAKGRNMPWIVRYHRNLFI